MIKTLKIFATTTVFVTTSAVGGNIQQLDMIMAANGFSVESQSTNDDLKSSFSLSISSEQLEKFNDALPSLSTNPLTFHKKNLRSPTFSKECKQFDNSELAFDCQASVLKFSGLAEMPFEEGFSIYGKLGLQYLQRDNTGAIDLLRLNLNDIGAVFGFGLKYEIKKDWYLSAESAGFGENQLNFIGIGSGRLIEPRHSIGLSVRF